MKSDRKRYSDEVARGALLNLMRQGKLAEAAAEIRLAADGRDRIRMLDPKWAAVLRPAVVSVSTGEEGRDLGRTLYRIAVVRSVAHESLLTAEALTVLIRDAERRPGMEPLADICAGYLAAARAAGAAHAGEVAA